MARWIILAALLFLVAVYFLQTSTSSRSLNAYLGSGADAAAVRARVVAFAREHDWRGELARAGVALSAELEGEILAPLSAEASGTDPTLLAWEVRVIHRGFPDAVVGPERMERACRLIQARLSTECDILRAEGTPDAETRRRLCWDVYGSGFDERARDFFAARRVAEPDPELRALAGEFHERLERSIAARAGAAAAPAQPPHSQRP